MAHAWRLQRANLRFLCTSRRSDMFNCPSAISWFLSSRRSVLFFRHTNEVGTIVLGGLSDDVLVAATCEWDDPFVCIHDRIIVHVGLDHVVIIVLCLVQKLGWGPLMFLKSLISYRSELLLRILRVLVQLTLSHSRVTIISSMGLTLVYSTGNFFDCFVLQVLRFACFSLVSLSLVSRWVFVHNDWRTFMSGTHKLPGLFIFNIFNL